MATFDSSAAKRLDTYLRGETTKSPTAQQATAANPPSEPSPRLASAAPVDLDDLVRTRLEKNGGAIYVEEPVPNRTPAPAAVAAAKEKQPVTLALIVEMYGITERKNTRRHLLQGQTVATWILKQPELLGQKLDRASALKMIGRALLAAHRDRRTCRPDRDLRCWYVARLLGGEAESLSIAAIREMQPLIERDKTPVIERDKTSESERDKTSESEPRERWQLLPAHAEQARALWARMLDGHLSADQVRDEVHKILPAKTLSIRKHRPIKVRWLLKFLDRLPPADLRTVIERSQELESKTLLAGERVA